MGAGGSKDSKKVLCCDSTDYNSCRSVLHQGFTQILPRNNKLRPRTVTIRDAAGDLPRDRGIRRAVIGRLVVRRGLPGGYIFERDPLNLFSL